MRSLRADPPSLVRQHPNVGVVEEEVGRVDCVGRYDVSTPRQERRDLVMLQLGVACVVHGETKERDLLPRLLHQQPDRGLASHNLLLNLLQGQAVDIRMGVRVVSEIESMRGPLLKDARSGCRTEGTQRSSGLQNLLPERDGPQTQPIVFG